MSIPRLGRVDFIKSYGPVPLSGLKRTK